MWRRPDPLTAAMVAMVAGAVVACSASHPARTSRPATSTTTTVVPVPPSDSASSPAPTAAPKATGTTTGPPTTAPTKPGSPPLPPGQAHLVVSPSSGPAGTLVSLSASGCPASGGYSAFYADSTALAHAEDPSYRHAVAMKSAGPDAASGTYRVTPADSPGYGVFEVQSAAASNATAGFTVDR